MSNDIPDNSTDARPERKRREVISWDLPPEYALDAKVAQVLEPQKTEARPAPAETHKISLALRDLSQKLKVERAAVASGSPSTAIEVTPVSSEREAEATAPGAEQFPVAVVEIPGLSPPALASKLSTKVRAELEKANSGIPDAGLLLRQLEQGPVTDFDANSLSLLREVLADDNKRSLLTRFLMEPFRKLARAGASTAAGAASATAAANYGGSYVTGEVMYRLLQQFEPLKAPLRKIVSALIEQISGLEQTAGQIGNDRVYQGVTALLDKLRTLVSGIHGVTDSGLKQAIDGVATAAGAAAMLPAGAVGWFAGSGLVGGVTGILREHHEAGSYARLSPVAAASDERIKNGPRAEDAGKDDPRHTLLVMEKMILEDPTRLGFKLSNEEWLQFTAAAHRARVDLIHEKTRAPQLAMDEQLRKGLNEQQALVERVAGAERALTELDRERTATLLAQYDSALLRETDPVQKHLAGYNGAFDRLRRYSKAFAGGAFRATGVPLVYGLTLKPLLKVWEWGARATASRSAAPSLILGDIKKSLK